MNLRKCIDRKCIITGYDFYVNNLQIMFDHVSGIINKSAKLRYSCKSIYMQV